MPNDNQTNPNQKQDQSNQANKPQNPMQQGGNDTSKQDRNAGFAASQHGGKSANESSQGTSAPGQNPDQKQDQNALNRDKKPASGGSR